MTDYPTQTDLEPIPARDDRRPIRVRGRGSAAWAKLVSFFLCGPVLAITLAGAVLSSYGQVRVTARQDPAAADPLPFLIGAAVILVSALFWAALARLSSFGPAVCGLACFAAGLVAFFRPADVVLVSRRVAEAVPFPETLEGLSAFAGFGGLLTLGALLLGLAMAASLGRRAPRRYQPDALGL